MLAKVPQSTEDIEGTLGRIVAGFPDIDDVLQDYESVYEYNIDNPDSKLDFRIMVLNGYPNAYTGEARKSIERIIYNHKRYGISLVLVENTGYDQSKEEDKDQRSLGSTDGVYYIDMPVGTTSTMAFRIPKDDAISIFPSGSSNSVLQMPEHVCMYTDMMSRFSFRPYIYKDINWDGWSVNNKGEAVND